MASGGIYDHIGGGFARYSVDREWLVPHFEKMLYDQALLVRVYAHAAVALATQPRSAGARSSPRRSSYVLRDLRQPSGGFSSAEDADSPGPDGHGHEGLFHTWTVDEVRAVLGADADAALDHYWDQRERQLRGPLDPQPPPRPGLVRALGRGRGRPAAAVRGPPAAGPRPGSTTRC